jgi:integrase
MQATAKITFQKRASKRTKDNLCPVKLCITYLRKQKYYSIVGKLKNNEWQFLSEEDIKKVTSTSPRGKYRNIAFEFKLIIGDAEKIINAIPNFSFNQFDEQFFNKAGSWDNVFAAIWNHIQDLKNENRLGYASSFESTLRAIKEFHTGKTYKFNPRKDKIETRAKEYLSGKELKFVDITSSWLKKFEKWMIENHKSETSTGIYMRNLRVIFNLAIKKGIKAPYPFTEYKPISSENRKMALEPVEIASILNYETKDPQEQFYRDLFMFSFFCNGANLSDLCRLKWSNIKDGQILFERYKTRHKRNKTYIAIEISETLQQIIDRICLRTIGYDGYLLPILKIEWDETRCYAEIKQKTKELNKYIRIISKEVGIKQNISSYTARHSFASIQSASGLSTIKLKDLLGHSSTNVTEGYIKSLDRKTNKEISTNLDTIIKNQNAG